MLLSLLHYRGVLCLSFSCPLCRAPLAHKDLRAGLQPTAADAAEDWAAAGGEAELGDIVVCDSKLKVLLKVSLDLSAWLEAYIHQWLLL